MFKFTTLNVLTNKRLSLIEVVPNFKLWTIKSSMKLPIVKTSIQVRYSDLDPLGHVSNNIYSQYLELARIEWANANAYS